MPAATHPALRLHAGGNGPARADEGAGGLVASASLIGRQLADVTALLSPFGASLRNAFLVFSREGLLVHSGLYDEQVYVAVPAEKFTSFQWSAARDEARAVFLANVDSRRGLLDVFRADKTRQVQNVAFLVTGEPPASVLTQVAYFREADTLSQASLVKHEFSNYSIMLPTRSADLTVSLPRAHLSRLQAVAKDPREAVVFSFRRARCLSAQSASGRAAFAVQTDTEPAGAGASSEHILARARGGQRRAALCAVRCSGDAPDFRLELESAAGFRRLLQKARQVGGDALLRFYLTPDHAAVLGISTTAPEGLTMFFFCRPAPPPANGDASDLEAELPVAAPLGKRPPAGEGGPLPRKRPRGAIARGQADGAGDGQ